MGKSNKIIYFDNGCRVCRAGALLASKSGFSQEESLNPLQEMEEGFACDMEKARYCNEIAVYDPFTKESRYGVKGILWVLEDKFGKIMRVFLFPPLYILINFFYHVFSYNRRMIAPVYTKTDNDCKPEFHWGYRLSYLAIGIYFSAVLYWCQTGLEYYVGKCYYTLGMGAGWIAYIVLILLSPMKNKMDYYGHLISVVFSGIFLQILFSLLLVWMDLGQHLLLFALLFTNVFTTYFHYKRVEYLNLSLWYIVLWFAIIHVSVFVVNGLIHRL